MVDGTVGGQLLSRALLRKGFWAGSLAAGALLAVAAGCSDESDEISFTREVRPILQSRCSICHQPGGVSGPGYLILDTQNPFGGGRGMVNATNTWWEVAPEDSVEKVVVPGDPDNSFLINKISGDLPTNGRAGGVMPPAIPPLTEEQLAELEQWVTDGALDDDRYRNVIQPDIFGDGTVSQNGQCTYCHYTGAEYEPDLTDPFNPDTGIVNVTARYRSNILRVAPGDPDNSLLVLKARLGSREDTQTTEAIAINGSPMPYQFERLSEAEVQTVRDWITEGALDN